MSAEDLTTQAGLSVQQDLALVNLLGITHVERNGHHYVNGMAALPRGRAAGLPATRIPTCTNAATARCGCASATAASRSRRSRRPASRARRNPTWHAMAALR